MSIIAAAIASLAIVLGGLALVAPRFAFRFYRRWLTPAGLALASGLRLTFGVCVLLVVPETPTGLALATLGFLSLVGAVVGPALGVERARRIVEWEARQEPGAIRLAGALVVVLGSWMTWALLTIAAASIAAIGAALGLLAYHLVSG